MIMSLKQSEIKFKPRIKLNHNIYMDSNHQSVIDFVSIIIIIVIIVIVIVIIIDLLIRELNRTCYSQPTNSGCFLQNTDFV